MFNLKTLKFEGQKLQKSYKFALRGLTNLDPEP
jgi:hypothetical protein